MPRKPRIFSPTGIYHITIRSVNQHVIFEEEFDYHKFLFILSDCITKFDIDIFAYCLMDNHIHLLIHSSPEDLSAFFQSVGTRFVRWYNDKYARSGHLFQERFHSKIIDTDASYLATLAYIHNNPVKAGICHYPSEYRWSSFNAFYGKKNPLVDVSHSYEVAGSKDSLLRFFSYYDGSYEDQLYLEDHPPTSHHFTDEQALQVFKSLTHLSSASDAVQLNREKRNEYIRLLRKNALTTKQIARLMDVSVITVKRVCKK